jgi:hypothetical protein
MLFVRLAAVRFLATRFLVSNKHGPEFTFADGHPSGFFETIFAFGGRVLAPRNDSTVLVVHEMFFSQTAYSFIGSAVHNLRPGTSNNGIRMSGKVVHSIRTLLHHFY